LSLQLLSLHWHRRCGRALSCCRYIRIFCYLFLHHLSLLFIPPCCWHIGVVSLPRASFRLGRAQSPRRRPHSKSRRSPKPRNASSTLKSIVGIRNNPDKSRIYVLIPSISVRAVPWSSMRSSKSKTNKTPRSPFAVPVAREFAAVAP
jgi:hypothetical protein